MMRRWGWNGGEAPRNTRTGENREQNQRTPAGAGANLLRLAVVVRGLLLAAAGRRGACDVGLPRRHDAHLPRDVDRRADDDRQLAVHPLAHRLRAPEEHEVAPERVVDHVAERQAVLHANGKQPLTHSIRQGREGDPRGLRAEVVAHEAGDIMCRDACMQPPSDQRVVDELRGDVWVVPHEAELRALLEVEVRVVAGRRAQERAPEPDERPDAYLVVKMATGLPRAPRRRPASPNAYAAPVSKPPASWTSAMGNGGCRGRARGKTHRVSSRLQVVAARFS